MKRTLYIAVAEIAAELGVGHYEKIVVTDDGVYNAIINVYEDGSFAYDATPAIVEN